MLKLRSYILAVFLCVLFSLCSCNNKDISSEVIDSSSLGLGKHRIVVAVSNDVPPYTFKMGSEVVGYNVDIINSIFVNSDIKVDFASCSFSDLFRNLESGKVDIIAVPVSKLKITNDIRKKFFISDVYHESYNIVLYNTKVIDRIDENVDLRFYKTGIVEDTTFFVNDFVPDNSNNDILLVGNYIDLIYRMKTRNIGYIIIDKNQAESFSALDRFFAIAELESIKRDSENGFVFVCSSKKVCEKMSDAIKYLRKKNSLNVLKKEWGLK